MKIIGLLNRINTNILKDSKLLDSYVFAEVAIEDFDGATMKAFDYTSYLEAFRYASKCYNTTMNVYQEDNSKVAEEIPADLLEKAIGLQKIILNDKLDRYADTAFQNLVQSSGVEISSWDKQEAEAKAYTIDNTTPTPFIDTLASARGTTKEELVIKILEKAAAFEIAGAQIIGGVQSIKDTIKKASTISEIKAIALPQGVSLHIFTKID